MKQPDNNTRVGKDALILTISKMLTLFINLVTVMLLSRFRTLAEYGTYSQLLIVSHITTSLFALGLPNSINYFLAKTSIKDERQKFLSVYYTLVTIICIIIGCVLVLAVPFIVKYFDNERIHDYIFFLAVFPWTNLIIASIGNVLIVYQKTKKLLLLNIVNASVALLAILIVQFFHMSFKSYMILFLIGEVFITIWIYYIVSHIEGPLKYLFDTYFIRKIFNYSIPIGIASLIGTISIEIDKLMIGRFFNTDSLAIYTNAAKELPITFIAASLTATLLPQMVKSLNKQKVQYAIDLWKDSISLSYIVICFFSMIVIVFAPQIISILYSDKYLPGVSVFRIYSLVLLLRVTYFGIILNSIGKTSYIFWASLISLLLNTFLNYIMYLYLGFVGPAISTFLSIGIVGILQIFVSAKFVNISFKKIFPWKNMLQITIINLVIGSSAYGVNFIMIKKLNIYDVWSSFTIGSAITFVYFLTFKTRVLILWKKLN